MLLLAEKICAARGTIPSRHLTNPTRALFLLFSVLTFSIPLRADDTDAAIDSDVQKMAQAFKISDAKTMVDMEYKTFIESHGGREAAIMGFARIFAIMRAHGVRVSKFEAIKPYKKISSEVYDYVIVPSREDFQIGSHQYEGQSFFVAVKFHDADHWQYLEWSPEVEKDRDILFPGLPKDLSLPKQRHFQIN
jgi:hypothetical protein